MGYSLGKSSKDIQRAKEYLSKKPRMFDLCNEYIDRLFIRDSFAIQVDDGRYMTAREDPRDANTDIKISPEIILLALTGKITIGAYTTSKENKCKFMSIDFDCPDIKKGKMTQQDGLDSLKPLVTRVNDKLERIGFKTVLEFSGYKGYHVFAFFDKLVESEAAYFVAKEAVRDLPFPVETFPKQPKLRADLLYGNQIKLPLMTHKVTGQKSRFVDRNFNPVNNQYDYFMNMPLNNSFVLTEINKEIQRRIEKKRRETPQIEPRNSYSYKDPFQVVITGPMERHQKQFQFAVKCYENGFSQEETMKLASKWLEMYSNHYTSTAYEAEKEMYNCIQHVWRKKRAEEVEASAGYNY